MSNGRLLKAAEDAEFDILLTRDRDFLDRRVLSGSRIAVVLLVARGQSQEILEGLIGAFALRMGKIAPGSLTIIEAE